jgi:hypothetical protein
MLVRVRGAGYGIVDPKAQCGMLAQSVLQNALKSLGLMR